MAGRRVTLGPTGELVRQNLQRLRRGRSGSDDDAVVRQREISERLASSNHPMPVNTISEIELGARRVDVDDLVALASALRVSPLALLLPTRSTGGDVVTVSGADPLDVRDAWRWLRDGEHPEDSDTDNWFRDTIGAVRSMPMYQLDDVWFSVMRAAAYPESNRAEVTEGRRELDHLARVLRRRLIELRLITEQTPVESIQQGLERMILDLLAEQGSLDHFDMAARPGDGVSPWADERGVSLGVDDNEGEADFGSDFQETALDETSGSGPTDHAS